jgi:hypothetical protein
MYCGSVSVIWVNRKCEGYLARTAALLAQCSEKCKRTMGGRPEGLGKAKLKVAFLGGIYGVLWVLVGRGIEIDPGLKEDMTKIGEILTCGRHHGTETEDMKPLFGQHLNQITDTVQDVEDSRSHFDLSKQQLTK